MAHKCEAHDYAESVASSGWGMSQPDSSHGSAMGEGRRVRKVRGPKTNKAPAGDQQQALVGAISDIVSELMTAYKQGRTVNMLRLKQDAAAKNRLQGVPKLTQIIAGVPEQYKKQLLPLLKAKPVRTASGIAVVAVMSKPHRCPHIAMTGGVCIYCPGGPDSDFEYSTQSYTGYEPTSMRAIRARYDPFLQTKSRVDQLQKLGHSTDKVEFILMGGTFMSLDIEYRDWFIRNLHDALSGHTSSSVSEAIQYSEQSNSKCIGITIETRPDYCLKPHLSNMLTYGCTRLEIGVQSVYEDVARDTNRGTHSSKVLYVVPLYGKFTRELTLQSSWQATRCGQ